MNDFSELEADLKRLRPVAASPELARRIEQDLAAPALSPTAGVLPRPRSRARSGGWWSLGLGLTGVVALLVIGLTFFDQTAPPRPVAAAPTETSKDQGFQPAGLTQVVYRGRDEGLVFPPNDSGTVRRRLRYETRETMRWRNAQTGASVRVSFPAEQVVLAPVSYQ